VSPRAGLEKDAGWVGSRRTTAKQRRIVPKDRFLVADVSHSAARIASRVAGAQGSPSILAPVRWRREVIDMMARAVVGVTTELRRCKFCYPFS
jgi:hypothetical protein